MPFCSVVGEGAGRGGVEAFFGADGYMSCVWRETTRKDRAWPWETEKESEKVLAFGEKSVPRCPTRNVRGIGVHTTVRLWR